MSPSATRLAVLFAVALALPVAPVVAGQAPAAQPALEYHLPLHDWQPLGVHRDRMLATLESLARFSTVLQDNNGAIIDPFLKREIQYSTPYYAFAVATLAKNGRALDLLPHGIQAMEHSTLQFQQGRQAIPDQHGEFFIAALTESLDEYRGLVPEQQWQRWRERLRTPIRQIVGSNKNNWMTYSMKGEWLRYKAGLASRDDAVAFIERCWQQEQRPRIVPTPLHLYHDWSSDPDTLSVEAVGRGNLMALVAAHYDGPSAAGIRQAAMDGTRTSLFLQDPSGQLPANGRTDDHVWPDIGQGLIFQVMANIERGQGNDTWAARYQRGADLAFTEVNRWMRTDDPWKGTFSITKNFFDPSLRVGYQDASHFTNYTGSAMFHLAEAFNASKNAAGEQPVPSETGGYVLQLDNSFDTVIAAAAGMQVQINLRGQAGKSSGNYWTPLGIVRIARAGWDTRLGPSDGALTADTGVSLAPEFKEDGRWLRLASLSSRYRGAWETKSANPALVHGVVTWHPLAGQTGPVFATELWITPDGVYIEDRKTSADSAEWATTWPLLSNDGRALQTSVSDKIATTSYSEHGDSENFLALSPDATLENRDETVRSTFGDLIALRVRSQSETLQTFVVPRKNGETPAALVQRSFRRTARGFTSQLGTLDGEQYTSATLSGGVGRSIVRGGSHDTLLSFEKPTGYVARIGRNGVESVETDSDVHAESGSRRIFLRRHVPQEVRP